MPFKILVFIISIIICLNSFSFGLSAAEELPAAPTTGQGDDSTLGRDMILMAVYGTMSGMIIGAASLAFTSRPLSKLRRVAIGASLGLYVGILLGGLVFIDRSLGSGPSIFDVPIEEEVPIVYFRDNSYKINFPTISIVETQIDHKDSLTDVETKTWLSAPLLKISF